MRQELFIGMTLSFLLFPSLVFASREEVMKETLRKLELGSSEEAAEESSSVILNKRQAIYGPRRYQEAKEKLRKEGYPIKRGIPAEEENVPASRSLQDYYAYVLEKYRKAKDKGESEQESFFAAKEDAKEEAKKTKRIGYVSGGYNANHMHYKETIGKRTVDEDYGKLKGFYLDVGYRDERYVPWLMGRPFIEAYYRRYDSLITYDGASSSGPLSFKERAEVHRYGIKAGVYREWLKKGELFGYFDLGKRVWYRGENETIQGVLTYAEKFWWVYYGLGVGFNYRIWPKFSWGVDIEGMTTHKSQRKMRADLYEGATFSLGGVYGTEIKVPLKYYFLENASFDLTPYFTYWEIHASDTRVISGTSYYEPDSATHIEGILVGFSYLF